MALPPLLQKARYARSLIGNINKAAPAVSIHNPIFEGDDADIAATILGSFGHLIGAGNYRALREGPMADEERAAIVAAVRFQQEQGLALLSDGARKQLQPVLDTLNLRLAEFASGQVNAIEAGRALTDAFNNPWDGGPLRTLYTDWQFSRLARTETAFAYSAAERERMVADGISFAAIESVGAGEPPLHPGCLCIRGIVIGANGVEYAVIDHNPAACEFCVAIGTATYAAIDNLEGWRGELTETDTENLDIWQQRRNG